jgi:hypothetical protein
MSLGTFLNIALSEYCPLREKGAPKAIPTICVFTVKRNKNLLPLCAKSSIVVLSNHEDHILSKSNLFAPMLWSSSLQFLVMLAVKKHHPLWQGNYKNTFYCQGILPDNEITII